MYCRNMAARKYRNQLAAANFQTRALVHLLCTFAYTSVQEAYFYKICGLLSMSYWLVWIRPPSFWFTGLFWTPLLHVQSKWLSLGWTR